jgi:hypothetical protein
MICKMAGRRYDMMRVRVSTIGRRGVHERTGIRRIGMYLIVGWSFRDDRRGVREIMYIDGMERTSERDWSVGIAEGVVFSVDGGMSKRGKRRKKESKAEKRTMSGYVVLGGRCRFVEVERVEGV